MSSCVETEFSRNFYRQLIRLRQKADSLPKKRRTELQQLADQIGAQHLTMQDSCEDIRRLTDELFMAAETARLKLCADHHDDALCNHSDGIKASP